MYGDGFGGAAPGSGWDSSSGPDWPQGGSDGAGRTLVGIIVAVLLLLGGITVYAVVKARHDRKAALEHSACAVFTKQDFEDIVNSPLANIKPDRDKGGFQGPMTQCDYYTLIDGGKGLTYTIKLWCGDSASTASQVWSVNSNTARFSVDSDIYGVVTYEAAADSDHVSKAARKLLKKIAARAKQAEADLRVCPENP